jgi:signal transduction histidine kinase
MGCQSGVASYIAGFRQRFHRMIAVSKQLSPVRSEMLRLLLNAADPRRSGGRPVLRPLWANEAMHRAYSLVSLTLLLDRHIPRNSAVGCELEVKNALALAESFRALEITNDLEIVGCSDLLRTTTLGLVELFGPAVGNISATVALERICLPAFKRRALTLACSELVINSLRHAFAECSDGSITVLLTTSDQSKARLTVRDDGRGIPFGTHEMSGGIATDLAFLLEGDLEYRSSRAGGTIAEINFMVGM